MSEYNTGDASPIMQEVALEFIRTKSSHSETYNSHSSMTTTNENGNTVEHHQQSSETYSSVVITEEIRYEVRSYCTTPFAEIKQEIQRLEPKEAAEGNNDDDFTSNQISDFFSLNQSSVNEKIQKLIKCKSKKLTKEQKNILGAEDNSNKELTLLNKKKLKVKVFNEYLGKLEFQEKKGKWTSFNGVDDLAVKTFINKEKELIIVKYMPTDDTKLLEMKRELIKEF